MSGAAQPNGSIRVLVVDDESLARRNLTVLLRRDPDIGEVDECSSGQEAVETLRKAAHELVFLDVQMPECGGFDVLELLGGELPPAIVFVTAYEEYALRAFEAGALDYLMKPFDDARFVRALNRAKDKIAHYSPRQPRFAQRVVVRDRGQILFVNVADIDWIEAAGYYACLHVNTQTHIIRRTLAELARDLGDENFVRIHRSVIVNLARVCRLELQDSGEYAVVLKSNARLKLSRRVKKSLRDRLTSFAGSAELRSD
jgi:two-component system, LytTR family, response regulator